MLLHIFHSLLLYLLNVETIALKPNTQLARCEWGAVE
jgi:hypothetical protein